jgi:hypothetical protein
VLLRLFARARLPRPARRQARPRRRALVGKMEALGFGEDEDEYRRAFLFEGVSWRNQYTRVAHGELTREQIRSDQAWSQWRQGAGAAVTEARRGATG